MSDDEQPPIESALDELSAADTPADLAKAHTELRRKIRASRRAQARQLGPLATSYDEMMALSDKLKADSVPAEERQKGIEAVLRQMWPFTRTWKYLCEKCNDTGLIIKVCRQGDRCNGISTRSDSPYQEPGKYQRLCTMNETYEHEYGVPCFCSLGARFREKPPQNDPTGFSDVGKSKPTRIGRR